MGGRNPVAVHVEPENLDKWRGLLDWHFRSFCRGGQWEPDGLWQECADGKRQLWVVWDDEPLAAVLTMAVPGPRLVVTHAAGRDRHAWTHLWAVLEDFARRAGFRVIEAVCRSGWEPFLKQQGMRRTHVTMEKAL